MEQKLGMEPWSHGYKFTKWGTPIKTENDEKVRFLVSYQTKECEKYHVLGK